MKVTKKEIILLCNSSLQPYFHCEFNCSQIFETKKDMLNHLKDKHIKDIIKEWVDNEVLE